MELIILRNDGEIIARASDDEEGADYELREFECLPDYPEEDAGFGKEWKLVLSDRGDPLWAKADRDLTYDERIALLEELYPEWKPGIHVIVGDRAKCNSSLYRCILAHTTQVGWEPDRTPSLWARATIDEWPEWVQPIGAVDAYMSSDKVSHNGSHWISLYDSNVWEPGVYGWEVAE